jgi:gliding motility-associated protein GldC
MKKSNIQFEIDLDAKSIPENITWQASDLEEDVPQQAKAISLNIWDHESFNTLRIDLWTKEMPVNDMKRFYIDCIGGFAQSILNATGDEFMSQEMDNLCEKLVEYLKKEENKSR